MTRALGVSSSASHEPPADERLDLVRDHPLEEVRGVGPLDAHEAREAGVRGLVWLRVVRSLRSSFSMAPRSRDSGLDEVGR